MGQGVGISTLPRASTWTDRALLTAHTGTATTKNIGIKAFCGTKRPLARDQTTNATSTTTRGIVGTGRGAFTSTDPPLLPLATREGTGIEIEIGDGTVARTVIGEEETAVIRNASGSMLAKRNQWFGNVNGGRPGGEARTKSKEWR